MEEALKRIQECIEYCNGRLDLSNLSLKILPFLKH